MPLFLPPIGHPSSFPLPLRLIAKFYHADKKSNLFARMLLAKRAEEWGWNSFQKTVRLADKVHTVDTPLAYLKFVMEEVEQLAKTTLGGLSETREVSHSTFMRKMREAAPQEVKKCILDQKFPADLFRQFDIDKTLLNWIKHPSLDLLKALASIDQDHVVFHVLNAQPAKTFLRLPIYANGASALLSQALKEGHVPLARLLLHLGALVDYGFENGSVVNPQMHVEAFDDLNKLLLESRQLPVHSAIWQGEKDLLPKDEIPLDAAGWSGLHHSVAADQYDLAVALLDRDPKLLEAADKTGQTPLQVAVKCQNRRLYDLLIKRGADQKGMNPEVMLLDNSAPQNPEIALRAKKLKAIKRTLESKVERDASLLAKPDGLGGLLFSATICGELDVVQVIAEHYPAKLRDKNKAGCTAAHIAALKGNLEMMQLMIKIDPSLLAIPDAAIGCLPLYAAAQEGHMNVVQWIAEKHSIRLKDRGPNGMTAVHIAAKKGKLEVLQLLNGKEASLLAIPDNRGCYPLHHAVREGRMNVVQWIAEHYPARLKDKTPDGFTSVQIAAAKGNLAVLQLLISRDASLLTTSDNSGFCPLQHAVSQGQMHVVQWLAEHYPARLRDKTKTGSTVAHIAALKGNLEMLQLLIKIDPSLLGIPDAQGCMPLYAAAQEGHMNVVQWIADKHSSRLNDRGPDGMTAAHIAARNGKLEVLQLLKRINSFILSTPDHTGLRPLHHAALGGHVNVVQWITQHYPDRLKDMMEGGNTAAHVAAGSGKLEVLQLLIGKDASLLGIPDQAGFRPLHSAANQGRKNVVEWITEHYPDRLKDKTYDGRTATSIAVANGYLELSQLLSRKEVLAMPLGLPPVPSKKRTDSDPIQSPVPLAMPQGIPPIAVQTRKRTDSDLSPSPIPLAMPQGIPPIAVQTRKITDSDLSPSPVPPKKHKPVVIDLVKIEKDAECQPEKLQR